MSNLQKLTKNNNQVKVIKGQYELYQIAFNAFLKDNNKTLDLISVQSFINTLLDKSRSTQLKAKTSIKQALESMTFNELEKAYIEKEFKTIKIKKPSKIVSKSKILSKEQILILKSKANKKTLVILEFLEMTGCRVSELAAVLKKDIKELQKGFEIKILGKGKKERFIYITKPLKEKMYSIFINDTFLICNSNKDKMTRQQVNTMLLRLGQKVNIHLNPHMLRHTFATNLIVNKNKNVKAVSNYLGHSTPAITLEMYTHDQMDMDDVLDIAIWLPKEDEPNDLDFEAIRMRDGYLEILLQIIKQHDKDKIKPSKLQIKFCLELEEKNINNFNAVKIFQEILQYALDNKSLTGGVDGYTLKV